MKNQLIAILSLITTFAFAHEGVELGPNGGRILEFSNNETLHGEVTVKGDTFHIALLDKDMKPLAIDQQTLTATNADRKNPKKLDVTSTPTGFTLPLLSSGEWLIVRFKESANAKAITARFEYDTTNCEGCNQAEWLCACNRLSGSIRCSPPRLTATQLLQVLTQNTVPGGRGLPPRRIVTLHSSLGFLVPQDPSA